MSLISRLWNKFRNPIRYVGRDLEGNKFYEGWSPNDPSRPKRTVRYHDSEDVWKYIGGGKRLAIQWSAWLTHTRPHPPTIEELQVDMRRQQRVLANVAIIEARDRSESEQMLRIRQEDAHQALEEAAVRNRGLLQQSTFAPSHPESSTNASTLPEHTQDTRSSSSSPGSESNLTQVGLKVLPPRFLTPATPRKPGMTSKFTLPSGKTSDGISNPESLSEQPTTSSSQHQEQVKNAVPPMPSHSTLETESWTPKARKRW